MVTLCTTTSRYFFSHLVREALYRPTPHLHVLAHLLPENHSSDNNKHLNKQSHSLRAFIMHFTSMSTICVLLATTISSLASPLDLAPRQSTCSALKTRQTPTGLCCFNECYGANLTIMNDMVYQFCSDYENAGLSANGPADTVPQISES